MVVASEESTGAQSTDQSTDQGDNTLIHMGVKNWIHDLISLEYVSPVSHVCPAAVDGTTGCFTTLDTQKLG